jgi:single-strand DNA-binding protein
LAQLKPPELNTVTISGNLAEDPSIRETYSGVPVANFRVVWSRRIKDEVGEEKSKICCIGVVSWYWLAKSCYEHLRKGSAVMIEGELQSKVWPAKNGENRSFIEIKARRIKFLNEHTADIEICSDMPVS